MAFPIFIIFIIPFRSWWWTRSPRHQSSRVIRVRSPAVSPGYPIGRSGVTLPPSAPTNLVADACAGLNSIFALEAIGVFYMSVAQHASKARNILLASLILPISLFNVTRFAYWCW